MLFNAFVLGCGSLLFDLSYDVGFNAFEIIFFRGSIALIGGIMYDIVDKYLEYKRSHGSNTNRSDDSVNYKNKKLSTMSTNEHEMSPLPDTDVYLSESTPNDETTSLISPVSQSDPDENDDEEDINTEKEKQEQNDRDVSTPKSSSASSTSTVNWLSDLKQYMLPNDCGWMSSLDIVYTLNFFTSNEYYPSNIWLITRGTLRIIATVLFYFSLEWIYLGTSVTLYDTVPIWSLFLDKFMFGRKLTWSHYLVTLVVIAGVILIVQPSFIFNSGGAGDAKTDSTVYTVLGYICPFASGIFHGFAMAAMQKFTQLEENRTGYVDTGSVIFAGMYSVSAQYAILGIIGSFIVYGEFLYGSFPAIGAIGIFYALGVGLLSLVGLLTVNFSIARLSMNEVSLLMLFEVIWAYVFELIIYNEKPNWIEIIGVLLIILPMCCFFGYNIYREKKTQQSLDESSPQAL